MTAETDFDQVNPAGGYTPTLDSATANISVLFGGADGAGSSCGGVHRGSAQRRRLVDVGAGDAGRGDARAGELHGRVGGVEGSLAVPEPVGRCASPGARYERALVYRAQGQKRKARVELERVYAENSSLPHVNQALTELNG